MSPREATLTDRDGLGRQIDLLHAAQRMAQLGTWSWDASSGALTWSPELYRIAGVDPATFTPSESAFVGLVDPDDTVSVEDLFRRARTTGEGRTLVAGLRRPDGTLRWIEICVSASVAGGIVAALVATVRDVTGQQSTIVALRKRDDRFRALVQHSSDVIAIIDATGDITYVSPTLDRLFGYRRADVVGQSGMGLAHLVHPDDLVLAQDGFARAGRPGASASAVFRVRAADGDLRWVETVFTNLLHEPAVAGYVLNLRDITDRALSDAALRVSEARYRLLLETAEEGVWAVDESGATTFVNQRMAAILGCRVEDLMARSVLDFIADAGERAVATARTADRRKGISETFDFRFVRPDGAEVWVLVSGSSVYDAEGRYAGALAMMTDITARKRAEAELRRSQRQLNQAQKLSQTASWDRDFVKGTIRWSDEYRELMGIPPEGGDQSFGLILASCHPDDRERMAAMRERVLAGSREYGEFRIVAADGAIRTVRVGIDCELDEQGTPRHLTGSIQDISEQSRLEDQLKAQALQDALTELGNRALLVDRLEHALNRRKRTGEGVALLFVDLDDFKTINDSLGHSAGDEILVGFAHRLLGAVRPADTAARFGGDEFAVLLDGADGPEAEAAAKRLLAELQRPFLVQGREVVVQASVGIALAGDGMGAEQLLSDADTAMYAAKRQARLPRYRRFEPGMHASARRRLDLRAGLEKAVGLDQIEIHFQPLVRLDSRAVTGVEALVRWNHPTQGLLPPAEFIPLAEESGAILTIGRQVLNQATDWVGRLNRARSGRPLDLSVNLSARQLADGAFMAMLDEALRSSGLDPERLILEVTESLLVESDDTVLPVLSRVRERGVRVAVDDFGTGYSSLGYLRRLPVDVLKIDRAFVTDVADSPEGAAVAQAVVRLAEVLRLDTLGEGIETARQASALLAIGCPFGQGYLFSRPLPGAQLQEALSGGEMRALRGRLCPAA